MWLISLVTDERARHCRARMGQFLDVMAREEAVREGLRVWRTLGDMRAHLTCRPWKDGAYVGEFPAWPPCPETSAIWEPGPRFGGMVDRDEAAEAIYLM